MYIRPNRLSLLVLLLSIAVPAFSQKNVKKSASVNSNTAAPAPAPFTPSADQRAILNEINAARANPAKYVKFLEEMKKSLNGNTLNLPGGTRLLTQNGADSFDDAIRDLKNTSPLKPFVISGGLSAVANLQLTDLKENLRLGHFGKDGSDLEMRMFKLGFPGPLIAENISYYSETASLVVLNMILDESSATRAHRKNLLSTSLKVVGIAFGKTNGDVSVCVIDFADRFEEKQTGGKGPTRVM